MHKMPEDISGEQFNKFRFPIVSCEFDRSLTACEVDGYFLRRHRMKNPLMAIHP